MTMSSYPDSMLVKDALQIYFRENNFKDGGYSDKYFKIVFGPIAIPLPNVRSRVEAVKIHDVHHLVTQYNADYKGEAEIGAWEIAGGCGKFLAAWLLNLGSVLIGLLFYRRPLLRAFLRGRKCRTNLYDGPVKYDEELLHKTLGELRREIALDAHTNYSAADYGSFVMWCVIALTYHLLILGAACWVLYKIISLLF